MDFKQDSFEGGLLMDISFEHPRAFWALLFLVPVWFLSVVRFFKFFKLFSISHAVPKAEPLNTAHALRRFKSARITSVLTVSFVWIFLVLAYAGISWGTASVPVQKSGNAVSLVFDISYSMLADDAPEGLTRLKAAVRYAEKLLDRLEGNSFSVVIAKGDGFILIPQTEDFQAVKTAVENLSPEMMTAAGSSLGRGIRAAVRSFPANVPQFKHILVFTDGDETDGLMTPSLTEALKTNIAVTLIGFGSERESEIIAGDGKTVARTALRTAFLKDSVNSAMKKAGIRGNGEQAISARYIDASETGSALKIIRIIEKNVSSSPDLPNSSDKENIFVMETQRVYRRGIFIAFILISVILGVFMRECDLYALKGKLRRAKSAGSGAASNSALLCIFLILSLSSCSQEFEGAKKLMQGTWEWHQQNYRKATVVFFNTIEAAVSKNDEILAQYALYGLASTYMMQEEYDASLLRFEQISPSAADDVRFAASYNTGIIAYRRGDYDGAVRQFREALLIRPSSIESKINLEISLRQQEEKPVETTEQSALSVSQEKEKRSSVADAVFNQVRENEQKKWKNRTFQPQKNGGATVDY